MEDNKASSSAAAQGGMAMAIAMAMACSCNSPTSRCSYLPPAFQSIGFGEMPSSRLDSHRSSLQNGRVESFTAFTNTISERNISLYGATIFCPLDGNRKNKLKIYKLRRLVLKQPGIVQSVFKAYFRHLRGFCFPVES